MFDQEQQAVEEQILTYCSQAGLPRPTLQWNSIPFSGQWGISTSFFALAAAEAKASGKPVVVAQRAQEIASQVSGMLGTPTGFDRVEAVRGYLNLYFSTPEYTRRVVDAILEQGSAFGRSSSTGQRILVEFSQPNTHKAFHVGHLRNAILGSAVCRILDAAGNEVIRANYIGDIGLHVIKWLWCYINRHNGEQPGPDLTRWMGDIYSEADRLYEDPLVQQEVRALFGRWDRRDPEIVDLWKRTRQWSLDGFEQIYNLLGIQFDRVYFESEVEEPGKNMVDELIRRRLAEDERPDGPVIIKLDELLGREDDKYRVLVVLRSDGTSLYATKDLALAIQKYSEYHMDRSVYVIDVRQSLYMQQIFKTLELMDCEWSQGLYHLGYEIVNLPGNVTMSSRDGTVVLLEDLVREAVARAYQIVSQKNPELSELQKAEISRSVALGSIKYPMLSRDNTKIVTFDWEAALDFNGQAAPYIQYAHVRASSILRKVAGSLPASMLPPQDLTREEVVLVDLISRLPREVQRAAAEYKPLYLSTLAFDLARAFNDFYNQCPVLQAEGDVRASRIRLTAAAKQAIANCLYFLGITAPQAM